MAIKAGDKVMLTMDSESMKHAPIGLKKLRGETYIVEKETRALHGIYYTLEGCVSPKGVPYAIMEDWMVEL